jgi:predicted Zn finger-like uncharacterized protein
MPRIQCPGCKAALRIDGSKRGRAVRCPKCDHRFKVPAPADDDEPEELEVVEKPKKRLRSYGLRDEPDAPRPMPRYDRDDEEDEDRPRIRRRRRGHGPQAVGLMGFLTAQWNLDKIVVVLSAGFWLLFTGLSLVFPLFLIGLFGIGLLMLLAARIWAIVAAFSEDSGAGCLTIVFPWYGLLGIEDRRPLFLFGVGLGYILTGIGIAAVLGAFGRFQ